MALAWKAGWVNALGGSNPPTSATPDGAARTCGAVVLPAGALLAPERPVARAEALGLPPRPHQLRFLDRPVRGGPALAGDRLPLGRRRSGAAVPGALAGGPAEEHDEEDGQGDQLAQREHRRPRHVDVPVGV